MITNISAQSQIIVAIIIAFGRSFSKGPASEYEVDGQDLKGQFSLQGATLSFSNIKQISLSFPDGSKNVILRANNGHEVTRRLYFYYHNFNLLP